MGDDSFNLAVATACPVGHGLNERKKLFPHEWWIVVEISSQMSGHQACLQMHQDSHGGFFV
jgi:hypothetical protein